MPVDEVPSEWLNGMEEADEATQAVPAPDRRWTVAPMPDPMNSNDSLRKPWGAE